MTPPLPPDTSEISRSADAEASTPQRTEEELLRQRAESPEEQAELSAMLQSIKRTRSSVNPWMRRLGWSAALLAFSALGLMTAVLVRDVRLATRMYGPQTVVTGGHANYRISVFNPEKTTFYTNLQGELWLLGASRKHRLFRGSTKGDVLLANVKMPAWPPASTYKLKLIVRCPAGEEQFVRPLELRSPTRLQPRYAPPSGRRQWTLSPVTPSSPYRVTLFTDSRAPVADLLTTFWLRVEENPSAPTPARRSAPPLAPTTRPQTRHSAPPAHSGSSPSRPVPPRRNPPPVEPTPSLRRLRHHRSRQPLDPFATQNTQARAKRRPPAHPVRWQMPPKPLQVHVRHGRSERQDLKTNAQGFVSFPYLPQLFEERWVVTVKGPHGTAVHQGQLKPEGYQLLLDIPRPVVPAGKSLFLRVDGLYAQGDLHIDVTQRGQRLWSTRGTIQGGRAALSITLPPHIRGLVGIQVYTEFYFPGEIHDERLVYIGTPTRKKLLAALKEHLILRGDGAQVYALEEFRRQLPASAPLSKWTGPLFSLFNARFIPPSLYYNSAEVRLRRLRNYQSRFRSGTIVFLAGLSGVVVVFLFGWLFLGYRRSQEQLRDAVEQHDLEHIEHRGLPWVFLFVTVLIAIFAVVILLFWAMQWTFDTI